MLPQYSHKFRNYVYEPDEDSFLLIDCVAGLSQQSPPPQVVLEVGPGSGVCLRSIGDEFHANNKAALILGSDISSFAARNTQDTLGPLKGFTITDVVVASLLSHIRDGVLDVVLFNPPYVPSDGLPASRDSVDRAWAGGNQAGDAVVRRFLEQLIPKLRPDGGVCFLLFEERNHPAKLLAQCFGWHPAEDNVIIKRDGESPAMPSEDLSIRRHPPLDVEKIRERRIRGERLSVYKITRKGEKDLF